MKAHELLRAWLKCTKKSVNALALAVGVSRQTIHNWSVGTIPHARYLARIEKATGGAVPWGSWSTPIKAAGGE